jgi:methionine-S-sulfoxide reductase
MRYTSIVRIYTSGKMVVQMSVDEGHSTNSSATEVATLSGGCFWCLEAVFNELRGVEKVESGYSGGRDPNPTYYQVCTGTTGHAEVLQLTFDPTLIAFRDILEVSSRSMIPRP